MIHSYSSGAESILTFCIVLFGFMLMITRSSSRAFRGALSVALLLFLVFYSPVWLPNLFHIIISKASSIKSPSDFLVFIGTAVVAFLFVLHLMFRLILGATFAERVTSGVLSRIIYDLSRLILLAIISIFRGFRRLIL